MRLIIHIGPHKTGTSFIQRALENNQDALAAAGVCYPQAGRPPRFGAHHDLVFRLQPFIAEGGFAAMRAEAQAINAHTMLLSAEGLCNSPLDNFRMLADELGATNVELLYYIRDPYSQFYSYWKERVRHGYEGGLTDWFVSMFGNPERSVVLNPRMHLDHFNQLEQQFSLRVCSYDGLLSSGRNILDPIWHDLLGIEKPFELKKKRVNEALSANVTDFLRLLIIHYRRTEPNADGRGIRKILMESVFAKRRAVPMDMWAGAEDVMSSLQEHRKTITLSRDCSHYRRVRSDIFEHYGSALFAGVQTDSLFPDGEITLSYFNQSDLLNAPVFVDLITEYAEAIRKSGYEDKVAGQLMKPQIASQNAEGPIT